MYTAPYPPEYKQKFLELYNVGIVSQRGLSNGDQHPDLKALNPNGDRTPGRETLGKWVKENKKKPPPITETPRDPHHEASSIKVIQHRPIQSSPDVEPAGIRIAVIPDVQAKPGVDFTFLTHVGKYIVHMRPDVIVCIGDFADMPSLSSYDKAGSKKSEGARYENDKLAVHQAMKMLMEPIQAEMKKTGWNPRLVMTLGNHEERILRAANDDPRRFLGGLMDLEYERWGWEVYPFLKPVIIEEVAFAHYFITGKMGRPASTANAQLNKKHMSCFAGHQQGKDMAFGHRADGRRITSIISGSCYEHDEDFMGEQGNIHWRGLFILNDVIDGQFDEMAVSLKYLRRRYGND